MENNGKMMDAEQLRAAIIRALGRIDSAEVLRRVYKILLRAIR